MNGKSLVTLVVAIVFGLGAMLAARQMLGPRDSRKEEETQEVLVAARDLKEEESIKADMLKSVRMVKSAAPPGAFSSLKDVEERWVKTAMLEGDVLIEKKLGPKGMPPGLVANIPKGMRAFAVDVTEQSSVSGFILPGHHVDIVKYENSDARQKHGETILQNVLVLAAGQIFTRPEEKSLQTRTVTLAVTMDDVHVLVAARAQGALSLALRGVNDNAMIVKREPKPVVDPEHERKLKIEQERRKDLEQELRDLKKAMALKEAMALKAVESKPKPPPPPKVVAVYRGMGNLQRVSLERPGVSVLAVGGSRSSASEAKPAPKNLEPTANLDLAAGDDQDP